MARSAHLSPRALARYAGSSAVQAMLLAVLQAVVLTLAFVVSILLAAWIDIPTWLPPLLLALAPLFFGATLREHARRTLIADFRGQQLLGVDLPIGVVQLVALLVLWRAEQLTFAVALWTVAAASSLSVIWFWWESFRLSVRWKLVKAHFASNLKFGSWLLGIAVAWLVCDLILRTVLAWFHGIEAVGTFASAYLIVSLINPIVVAATSFSQSLAARVYAASGYAGLWQFSFRGTVAAGLLALLASGLLATFGEPIVLAIFGKPYANQLVVGAVSLGFCLQAVSIPVEASQLALEQGRRLFAVSILRVALVLSAGVPLVWWLGAAGIGWTIALQSVVVLVVHWFFFSSAIRE
ncbi:MAG: lipopolysaccharide biosynthesis protein [Aeoliella sp.]